MQHIKEKIKEFVSSTQKVKNCAVTKIDCLKQDDFLSLFELMPVKWPNGILILRSHSAVQPIETKDLQRQPSIRDTDDSNKIRFHNRLKRRLALGKAYMSIWITHATVLFWLFFTLDTNITVEKRIAETLLTHKRSILYDMLEAVADKRKYDIIHEQDKQRNIILKIMIYELHKKLIFLCKQ